jgi:flagellar protein FliO/FliZ
MESTAYLQVVFSLVLVMALILGAGWMAQRFGFRAMASRVGGRKRLSVVEAAAVDTKRRIVLIRRDDVEHLVLIGGTHDLLLEAGIPAVRFTLPSDPPEMTLKKSEENEEKSP